MSEFRFLAGLGLPDYRIAGEALTPEEEAAGVQRSRWGGRHGIAGASAEGPQAFGDNIVRPLTDALAPGPLDLALAVATGPGPALARRLGAGAIAAAGSFVGDAEGAWLSPQQIMRMLDAPVDMFRRYSHSIPGFENTLHDIAQREGDQAIVRLGQAQSRLSGLPSTHARLSNSGDFAPTDVNRAFEDGVAATFPETGWIRTPEQWLYALDPARPSHNSAMFFSSSPNWQDMLRPAYAGPNDTDVLRPMFDDPLAYAAEPVVRNARGAMQTPDKIGSANGWISGEPGPNGEYYTGYRAGLTGQVFERTRRHELDHLMSAGRGDAAPYRGTNTAAAWVNNPDLREEYLGYALGDPNVPTDQAEVFARRGLYLSQPGEALARATAALYDQAIQGVPREQWLPFRDGWPDFRVR